MPESEGDRWRWRWPLLAAVLALAPHLPVLLGRAELFYDDHRRFSVPLAAQAAQALCHGQLPAWNPLSGLGAPLLADPQSLALHPGLLLACALPASHALGILFVFHLAVLAAGTTALLRALGARAGIAVGVGAAVALCGPAPSWLTSGPYLMTLACFPWTMLAAWLLGQGRGRPIPAALLLALALGLALRGGDIPGALCQALVALVIWASVGRKSFTALAGAGLVAVLIGAAAWLPLLWYLGRSVRAGGLSTAEAGRWSLHPAELVGLFVPHPAGLPLPENTFWPFEWVKQPRLFVHSYYVSALLAGAALWAAVGLWRDRVVRALWACALLLLIVASGSSTPLWKVLSVLFTFLRYPSKVAPYAVLLLAVVGGLGLSALLERGAAALAAVVAVAVGAGAFLLPSVQGQLARAAGADPDQIAMAAAQLRTGALSVAGLAALTAVVLLLRRRAPLVDRHAAALVGAILVADAAVAGSALWWTVPAPLSTPRPAWLTSSDPRGPRVIRAGELDQQQLHRDQVGYLAGVLRNERLLQPNTNLMLGAGTLEAYGLALGDQHQNLARLYQTDPTLLAETTGTDFLLVPGHARQRWIAQGLTAGRLQVAAPLPQDGAVVLRPAHPWPRAYTTSEYQVVGRDRELAALADGSVIRDDEVLEGGARHGARVQLPAPQRGERAAVRPVAWSAAALRFEVSPERPSLLVVAEAFAEGWHATVDGAAAPIYRANLVGRAVALPAGRHVVEMWFDVPLFQWAARLPAVGLALCFLALLFHLRRRPE